MVCVCVCVCVCVSSTRAKMAEHACCNVLLMCCYDAIAWHNTHTRAHTHSCTHACMHARAHAHAHARAHLRARAHTHTHTRECSLFLSRSLALSSSIPFYVPHSLLLFILPLSLSFSHICPAVSVSRFVFLSLCPSSYTDMR
jgi:hypothetical protein